MAIKNLVFITLLIPCSCNNNTDSAWGVMGQKKTMVHICTGPMSKCYHSEIDCYGLKKCSKTVETITMEEAIKSGRKPCKYCH